MENPAEVNRLIEDGAVDNLLQEEYIKLTEGSNFKALEQNADSEEGKSREVETAALGEDQAKSIVDQLYGANGRLLIPGTEQYYQIPEGIISDEKDAAFRSFKQDRDNLERIKSRLPGSTRSSRFELEPLPFISEFDQTRERLDGLRTFELPAENSALILRRKCGGKSSVCLEFQISTK